VTGPAPVFSILAVCTGNICRSPMIERLLAARLRECCRDEAHTVSVTSAGTWGHEGAPMEAFAAQCLIELGGDPDGFVARELDADMTARADLILGATREHRAAAVTLVPTVSRRCFTLLEFTRLLSPVRATDLPGGPLPLRLRALVEAAAGNRGLVRPERATDDDIEDPYGAPLRVFSRVADVIDAAVAVPVRLLAH
jgi:protein-tyrosine phosphatase